MRLILVRHGQTPSNVEFLLDTATPGPGLTALGEKQAAALPQALADEKIDALYASTLTRAQLTAAPLAAARGLEVRVREGIRELSAGDLEMLRGDTKEARAYLTTAFAWASGETALRMPGGESGTEALGRFDAVVAEAAESAAGAVAMVSHGAAIRVWTAARARNVEVSFATGHRLDNTDVVILEGSPEDGWTAVSWAGTPLDEAASGRESGPTGQPLGPAGESAVPNE
ncbi:histidine phosphatase family protein [Streptomyces sp. NBC_01571]|uniref:histidine phosphatase family protein n=1 Tax=Streptomyces sp. NBC_01571 TaxID=2975883 RepID=UPI002250DFCC|nr:histidine phosphatase family protein [Streptomyces sp. NBC_01571]MCX4574647.1 histidine phosphatase family protein [Streptomyces sp. NBC_01571]